MKITPMTCVAACALLTLACATTDTPPGSTSSTHGSPAPNRDTLALPPLEGPLTGKVRGADFACEDAKIESGILTLRQGAEFFADLSLTVFLFLDEGEVPAGRSFHVDPSADTQPPLHVHVARVLEEGGMPDVKMAMDDFAIELEFGQVDDKKLPGTIRLTMNDEMQTRVAGSFEAEVAGFILVDGKPDRTSDSIRLLEWIGQEQVEAAHPDTTVEIVEHSAYSYFHPHEDLRKQHGSGDVQFRIAGAEPETWRLRFVKETEGWIVRDRFDSRTVLQAHPLEDPDVTDANGWIAYRMARHLESELASADSGPGVYDVWFSSSWNNRVGMGEGRMRYKLGRDGEPIERRFLLRLKDEQWRLDRELRSNEVVDYREAKVGTRAG